MSTTDKTPKRARRPLAGGKRPPVRKPAGPYARSLAAAGTVHSDWTDVSIDKYGRGLKAPGDRRTGR